MQVGHLCLNESPSEKEGKLITPGNRQLAVSSLNESPSEKEGKFGSVVTEAVTCGERLNESPSEKEGKCPVRDMFLASSEEPQ